MKYKTQHQSERFTVCRHKEGLLHQRQHDSTLFNRAFSILARQWHAG